MDLFTRITLAFLLMATVACAGGSRNRGGDGGMISPPSIKAAEACNYDGLHNVVAFSEGLYSGSAPEGEAGFDVLASMGVQTVISVDGARPDVELARAHGMRYVHLPIGYNGMSTERTLEIARAIRDLPGPVYIHCHHGKHRSAGTAGAAAVTLGRLSPEEAAARMGVSGTSPSYPGLFQCVAVAAVAAARDLDAADDAFPETWTTSGLVQSMVEIDHAFGHLRTIDQAQWRTPPSHPDLVPAAEAGHLADLFRELQEDEETIAHGVGFIRWVREASGLAASLEEAIVEDADGDILRKRLRAIGRSCTTCHSTYRDAI